mgnify:CR=1 FL=1|jgi:hypothetical protein
MDEEIFTDEGSAKLFQLIHMLQRSALVHLGYIPDHQGKTNYNYGEAKAAIDLLVMLEEKTRGNLNDIEEKILKGIISEIQMQYVKAPEAKRSRDDAAEQSEVTKSSFIEPKEGPSETVVNEEE